MASYEPGAWKTLAPAFPGPDAVTTDASAPMSSDLLAKVTEEASARGMDAATLLDMIVREALEG